MNTAKALIYCRVSSRNQEEDGHGLESQETRCRQHAAARGYEVAAVFPDTMTGGGDFMKRKGMVALLSFIDAQPDEAFVVIFDDLKRFARDREFHFRLRDAFRERNTRIECLNFAFDDSPEGEFMETIFAAQGQLERKQNSRQVAQKMRARMENGYWIHTAPVGYRYQTIKGQGKVLVPNPPFDDIIREAFEGYANGRFQSQAEVKRFFESIPHYPRNRKGVITQQRVTDILTQPIYTGYICSVRYGLIWLKGHHEPLISVETFQKVQDRRAGTAKAPKRANVGDDFALRGFVCCDGCGVPLRSSWAKGRHKHYAYYLCQTKTCDAYGKSIPRDQIEGEVGKIIKTLQPSKELIQMASAMFRIAWEARRALAANAIASGKQQIQDISKQIDTLLERILGATSETVIQAYEAKIGDLERAKAIATEQLAKHAEPKGNFEEKLEPVLTFLANPWKLWENGQTTLRRAVLRLCFADRLNYCRIEGARTADLALPFKALGALDGAGLRSGAQEKTRTSTPLRELAPEASASTNSATWAGCVSAGDNSADPSCQRLLYGFAQSRLPVRDRVTHCRRRASGLTRYAVGHDRMSGNDRLHPSGHDHRRIRLSRTVHRAAHGTAGLAGARCRAPTERGDVCQALRRCGSGRAGTVQRPGRCIHAYGHCRCECCRELCRRSVAERTQHI